MNESINELYTATDQPLPNSQSESTITLATGTRDYALASDLVQIRWPMIDKTNSQFLFQYAGGYDELLLLDPEQDDTGLPIFACIRPTDGHLFVNRAPTSSENGRVYTYQYDKSLLLSAATDTVPFNDVVFMTLVPAWAELWKRTIRHEYDAQAYKSAMGIAGKLLTQQQPRTSWLPR